MSTVITFDPFGDAQFTRGSAGAILAPLYTDMRMERVTEIQLDPETRTYFIEWRLGCSIPQFTGKPFELCGGDHSGIDLHIAIFRTHEEGQPQKMPFKVMLDPIKGRFLFDSYEVAVQYEVACLNALRLKGITF